MVGEGASVILAMSGGVDSSSAAVSLVEEGYRVIGVTFRMWEEDWSPKAAGLSARCSLVGVEEAARAARVLDIEHVVIDLRERFHAQIVEPFAREYLRGRTPNPCVECNRLVKFPTLIEVAEELGADAIATGHYARICRDGGGAYALLRSSDRRKDQSYVLYGLGREQLSRCLFPNGERSKGEVREMALARGVAARESGESQEICFLCGGSYRDFISRHYPEALAPGPVLDTSGVKLGEHRGIACYTVGQRRGLGVSAPRPLYVVALDPSHQAVILGGREEVPGKWLHAALPHWIKGEPPAASFEAEAMARYNTAPEPCRVELCGDGFELSFERRVWALTPGQHAVLYHGDQVLGGGVIASVR
ncbi:MAG: tRNA 2-thiouridine(34) synthase MnmA [Actinobacteria bacterium]|jgi:tRNA-specific 2-thiouridylase|nr:MAG: tRNA 2-thiouridine(34) synthase MnmA [Actinomycetota bacterium]